MDLEKEVKSNLENNQYNPILSPAYNVYPYQPYQNIEGCDHSSQNILINDDDYLENNNENSNNNKIEYSFIALCVIILLWSCLVVFNYYID